MQGNLHPVHLPEDLPEQSAYVEAGPAKWDWRSGAYDGMPTMPTAEPVTDLKEFQKVIKRE